MGRSPASRVLSTAADQPRRTTDNRAGSRGRIPASNKRKQTLFANRYVDDKGAALPYDPEYPHAKHPIIEFKMMPIFMSFVMDQRRLPTLLVECANSSMPIEVRGVRVLRRRFAPFDPGRRGRWSGDARRRWWSDADGGGCGGGMHAGAEAAAVPGCRWEFRRRPRRHDARWQ